MPSSLEQRRKEHEKWMQPGVKSGRILLLERQWRIMEPVTQELYEPILVGVGITMYRYRFAPEPYRGKQLDVSKLNPDDEWDYFQIIVNNFIVAFGEGYTTNMVEGDEDEDFTYGAFCTACATTFRSEADWLLTHELGTLYTIQNIDGLEHNEDR